MKNPLISVIVPVYNVEPYLMECLDSILGQSFSSFELIIVDDGSTDGSPMICDTYKNTDERIKVIHKENGGLSSARNAGLDIALGEYVCFIDSDDRIAPDFLEKLLDRINEKAADIAFCDVDFSRMKGACEKDVDVLNLTSKNAREWLYDHNSREYVLMVITCNKLFRRALFEDLRYPEGRLHEDEFMIWPLLNRAKRIVYISEKLYLYRDNEAGITSGSNRLNVRHLDVIDAYEERIRGAMEEGDRAFACKSFKTALYKMARLYKEADEEKGSDQRSAMLRASMKRYKELYNGYKQLFDTRQKLKYSLFFISPKLFLKKFF
ncbi:MAG: glycosyltransferase [Butyrivibrio sp.]|nr:glycosyltransferase [Butyrivibrio sp.]